MPIPRLKCPKNVFLPESSRCQWFNSGDVVSYELPVKHFCLYHKRSFSLNVLFCLFQMIISNRDFGQAVVIKNKN